MTICALVHRLEIPSEADGDHALTALLRDEMVFSQIFERFVRNFYRYHLVDCDVRSEELQWHDELGSPFVPVMRTDTTIETKTRPPPACGHRHQVLPGALGLALRSLGEVSFGHLYQIYAYLRTQEDRSEHHRSAEGCCSIPRRRLVVRRGDAGAGSPYSGQNLGLVGGLGRHRGRLAWAGGVAASLARRTHTFRRGGMDTMQPLTLFSWGYWGLGHIDQPACPGRRCSRGSAGFRSAPVCRHSDFARRPAPASRARIPGDGWPSRGDRRLPTSAT